MKHRPQRALDTARDATLGVLGLAIFTAITVAVDPLALPRFVAEYTLCQLRGHEWTLFSCRDDGYVERVVERCALCGACREVCGTPSRRN